MGTSPLALAMLLAFCISAALPSQAGEEVLRKQFLDESFVDGKAAVARKLAALGNPAARKILLELFALDSSWDRAGAFLGLIRLKDAQIDAGLAEAWIEDRSLESFVSEELTAQAARFVPRWKALWDDPEWDWHRERILQAIGLAEGEDARLFLEEIIRGTGDYRDEAFQAYSSRRRPSDLAFARSLVSDQELKPAALARIVSIGTAADLPLFEKEFFADTRLEVRLPALQAFSSWAGRALKERAFASALADPEAPLRETACLLFAEIRSPELMALAASSAAGIDEPFAALGAAEYLAGYGTEEAVALAVPAFQASYYAPARRPGFGDWVAGVFTLGISRIMDQYQASSSESSFRRRKEELARVLSSLAGRKLGPDYAAWESWCLSRGLTVAGRNLIQDLFSSERGLRDKARAEALFILGLGAEEAFQDSDPAYAALDSFDRGLRLAALLRRAGYPKGFK